MRPLKDILVEEYWDVLYRKVPSPETGVFAGNPEPFGLLGSDKRYWYADTFLFKKDNRLYLFLECIDNVTEIGSIAVSELVEGQFTKPEIVIKENTHLSYPFVFEREGAIYMMPETHQENCIRLYRAVEFPRKWVKDRVIVDNVNSVDSVVYGDWLITGELSENADMSVDLKLYRFGNGEPHVLNPVKTRSFDSRGAGALFEMDGKTIRPAQNCSGSVYGQEVVFYDVISMNGEAYAEKKFFTLKPEDIPSKCNRQLRGTHTYAFLSGVEVVDVKLRRFNFKRILWILSRKARGSSS